MSRNNDLYTPKKKVMPEVPGVRFEQRNYYDIGLLDGSFADKLYISVVEQIDDAIVAECVKIAHEAGIGQHIVLNKKFIADAIREKLEAQQAINNVQPVDAEVVRHGRWIPYFEPMECFVDVYLNTEIRDVHMGWICSECGRYEQHGTTEEMPYCHCGAKMDGDVDADQD